MTSSIFDPVPICIRNSLNRAKSNYGFHWKLKVDRAFILIDLDSLMAIFDFCHLQGQIFDFCHLQGQLLPKLDQKLKFWVRPVSVKIRVSQNALNVICITMRTTSGQNISSIWRSLLEVLPQILQNRPNWVLN